MPDQSTHHGSHSFGEFTLDVGRGALCRAGMELHLRPKSFEVLRHLVERPGRLVTKRELMDAVWGRAVVTEGSLTQCIIDIRRALGPENSQMVRTVPRRGFVFEPPPGPVAAPDAGVPPVARSRPVGRTWVAALAAAAVLLGIGIAWWPTTEPSGEATGGGAAPAAAEAPARSIAVLRFLDLSPAGDQGYFADGLAEEILHLLAQAPDLRVTARGSSFAFGSDAADVAAVAAQLGVRHVLEGSVRREADALRVTVQLIDARTQAHVWSRTYDRTFSSILALQSEIASDVAQALQVTLLQAPHSTSPLAAEAQDLYLLGRYLFHRRGPGDLAAAERHFEQAVALDPQHARAWTALAGAYNVRALDELRDPGYRIEEQRQAVERALAIDPMLAEAHVRLARYHVSIGDRTAAEAVFARARQLGPNDPLVLATLAYREVRDGRLARAIEIAQRVVAIDPLSAINRGNLGHLLMAAGQYPAALDELRRAQALSPARADAGRDLATTLLLSGRKDEARQYLASVPDGPLQDQLQVLLGSPAAADAALARLQSDRSARGLLLLAELAAHRGDADAAFDQLGAALRAHEAAESRLEFDLPHEIILSPFLRTLHADPRWSTLLQAMPSPWA